MDAYPIPTDALDDRLGFVGTSGSGKTYNSSTAVERLLRSSARVVIIDALDVWWGLRSNADGNSASGFNLPIFGGPHGDLPLNEHAGSLIGETVAGMSESCIVSLKGLPSDAATRRFVLAFLKALYQKHRGGLFHLVIDEADLFVPQVVMDRDGDAVKLKGLVSNIVRRGRVDGFIPWLITQRPAVIAKDVLSQVDGLVSFKLTSSQDRDALGGWIDGQADRETGKAILASLPTLPVGTGVVWIPGRGILGTKTFPQKTTFDSSRAPKRGEAVKSATLKPLDLGALKERLATVDAEAKADDPKALKAEVARLTAELGKASPGASAETLRAAVEQARLEGIEEGERRGEVRGISIGITRAREAINGLRIEKIVSTAPAPEVRADPEPTSRAAARPAPATPSSRPSAISGELGAKAKVLQSLAWWKAAGFPAIDRRRACIMAGYSPKASTFGVYVGQLSAAGLIEAPEPGKIRLTEAGEAEAPAPALGTTLVEAVRSLLSPAEVKVFDAIVAAHPNPIARGDLADAVGLSRTASTLGVYVGKVASFGFVESGRGQVRAADWLFPKGKPGASHV